MSWQLKPGFRRYRVFCKGYGVWYCFANGPAMAYRRAIDEGLTPRVAFV